MLEEVIYQDLLRLLQYIADIVALLLGCIAREHVKKVVGDAILKGLHAPSMLILVFIPLKISPWGCSDLTDLASSLRRFA